MTLRNLLVLLSYVSVVAAYPWGAPGFTCTSLRPDHGSSFQTSTPSYIISVFPNGSTLTVSISSNKNENFKGFIIGAFSSSSTPIGVFTSVDANTKQICSYRSAVENGVLEYPECCNGLYSGGNDRIGNNFNNETCNFCHYFDHNASLIRLQKTNNNLQIKVINGSFSCPHEDCVITWGTSAQSQYMDVSLQGRNNGVTDYIAMAYSVDDEMDKDSVIACFKNPTTDKFEIVLSYNVQTSFNVPVEMLFTWFIVNVTGEYSNGAIKCRFSQMITAYNESLRSDEIFYPADQIFHLLYATGQMNMNNKTLQKPVLKYSSSDAYSFTNFQIPPGPAIPTPTTAATTTAKKHSSEQNLQLKVINGSFSCPHEDCVITWGTSVQSQYMDVSLQGRNNGVTDYIAMAYSVDDEMDKDSVIACFKNPTTDKFEIALSYNLFTWFIVNVTGEYSNGAIKCRFSQMITAYNESLRSDEIFYPADQIFHLLYATGQMNMNNKTLQKPALKYSSSDAYSFTNLQIPPGPAPAQTTTTAKNLQIKVINGSFSCPHEDCVITWGTSAQSQYMDVSLQGRNNGVADYIAMAYSVDDEMDKDSVIACFKNPTTGKFEIVLSYNVQTSFNVPVEMLFTWFIVNVTGEYSNGAIKCRFSQMITAYNESLRSDEIFYPADQIFHLLYATGQMNMNNKTLRKPDLKYSSSDVYSFTNFQIPRVTLVTPMVPVPTKAAISTATPASTTVKKSGSSFVCPENSCSFTWSKSARAGYVDFKLEGPISCASNYIAIGYSLDDKMGDDAVISCYMNGTSCVIRLSFNTGRTNNFMSPPSDSFIVDKSGEYVNGMLRCSYSQAMRNGTWRMKRAAGNSVFYPADGNYYLLYATGSIQQNSNDQLMAYHDSRFASTSILNLTDFNVTSVASAKISNRLIKAHALQLFSSAISREDAMRRECTELSSKSILMVIAWLMCASTGMLLPRYFKSAWKDSKFFKQAIWFRLHQAMMSSVFILTSIAFIIIFCERMGYASSTLVVDSAHPPLGIIVMVLVFINPFLSFFRCEPTHELRWMFNVAHLIVGRFAIIVAVINIFLSFYMKMSNINFGWVQWVMVALIVYHTCMEILLLTHDTYLISHAPTREKSNVGYSEKTAGTNSSEPRCETGQVSIIKTTLIVCQWVGVTGLAIAICVGIGIAQ
ncbi:hypothetical protein HELRODRAFT_163505 [Helobdella robusta]|uniref:Cytochrome b561 domain-containing protein n=1 Tax=Helobdella robusta TaxID=6412 RepID=T1EU52_HELRO|nr:hypothetical protein HELRODRAFT_163505 [Helobdella robusta]ESN96444.1 hypothetical protein HELRODRAFT_163505 [Helobdella robusta]